MGSLKVGNYELVKLLGEGGMGSVYEGYHLDSKDRVAIKIINADVAAHSTVLARFELEARAAAAIQSPYVARVLDFGREQGAPFLVMELLDGKDLETVFTEHRILPPELVIRFATQCCLGLQKAHERGIVHRDIKPANLILADKPGSGDLVLKILDFGIAKVRADDWQALSDEPLTRTGSLLGSPRYMSPEQARGYKNIDQRTDLFSLAVVMYQALAGHTPHHRVEAMGDLIVTLCSDPAPSLSTKAPWVDPRLERIVARALSISVADRYASAADMAKDLTDLVPEAVSIPRALLRTYEPPVATTLPNPGALPAVPAVAATEARPSGATQDASNGAGASNGASTGAVTAKPGREAPPHPDESADNVDPFPLPWVAAGILLSLVVGVGSVAAGVIPLPSRPSTQTTASPNGAATSGATTDDAASAPAKTVLAPSATIAPIPSAAAPTSSATVEPSATVSARPALTGHLPTISSAPTPTASAIPKPPSSSPVSVSSAPPPTPPASPFPSDSPL